MHSADTTSNLSLWLRQIPYRRRRAYRTPALLALHLEASNLSPRTIRAYTDDGALLAAFLARQGMPTAVASIRREHVEAFIAAALE